MNFKSRTFKWMGALTVIMVAIAAYAIPDKRPFDQTILGKGSSTAPKQIEFNTGDSPNNVTLQVDDSRNGSLNTNQMTLGDGTSTGQSLIFDQGAAPNFSLDVDTSQNVNMETLNLTIGQGTDVDQTITFDKGGTNSFIRYNSAQSRLTFSNDGVSEKAIGSGGGGGGGINVLTDNNFDFEVGDPPQDFTSTGAAVFAAETGAPAFGDQSGSWDASATGEFLRSAAVAIPEGLKGRSCSARIQTKWTGGTPGDLAWRIEDSSDVLIAGGPDLTNTAKNIRVSADWVEDIIFFTCPSSGDMRIEIESTADAALLLTDNWELGKVGFVNVSQTNLVAQAHYVENGSCTWTHNSSAFIDFAGVSACPAITVDYSSFAVNTADDDLPNIVFDSLPAGTYIVKAKAALASGAGTTQIAIRVSDGTTNGPSAGVRTGASDTDEIFFVEAEGVFTYTAAGARNFRIQGRNGTNQIQVRNDLGDQQQLTFTVTRVPTEAAEGVTIEQKGFHWAARLGGSTDAILSTGAVSDGTTIAKSDISLTPLPNSGPVSIACQDGEAPQGLTCAGSEAVGFAPTITENGVYFACMGFTHQIDSPAGSGTLQTAWKIVEDNVAGVEQQSGHDVQFSGFNNTNAGDANLYYPVKTCSFFTFNSPGEKILKLAYAQSVSGTTYDGSQLSINRTGPGARELSFSMFKVSGNFPGTFFPDITNALKARPSIFNRQNFGICSFFVDATSGTPANVQNDGGCVDSFTDTSPGIHSVNFVAGYWASPGAVCTGTTYGGSDVLFAINEAGPTQSQINVRTTVGATGNSVDSRFAVHCIGPVEAAFQE